jgi:tetratricopeptide (TPR) repeat protein
VTEYHEVIGYHLEQAHRYLTELGPADDHARALAERAAGQLGTAGRRAGNRGDYFAAANLLGRAAGLLPFESRERLELLHPRLNAISQTQGGSEAIKAGRELTELAEKLGDRRLAAHGLLFTAPSPGMYAGHDPVEAQEILEGCVAVFEPEGDVAGLAMAERRLAWVLSAQGHYAQAIEVLERGLANARKANDPVAYRTLAQTYVFHHVEGPTPVAEAIGRCDAIGGEAGDDRVLDAVVSRCLAALEAMAGRFDAARQHELSASPVLEHAGFVAASMGSLSVSAYAKELYGDRAGAVDDLRQKWISYRDVFGGAAPRLAMDAAYRLAGLYCDDGRWEEAERQMAEYREAPLPAGHAGAVSLAVEARLAANAGEYDRAQSLARQAQGIADQTDTLNSAALVWTAVAEVEKAAGADPEPALGRAAALYEAKGNITAAARVTTSSALP